LEEKLDWLQANDQKAREIAENALHFADSHGTNLMDCYTGLAMLEYSRLWGE
jgi:hypothetical protein